jgi:polar amino acid transport system substrate-binding protein
MDHSPENGGWARRGMFGAGALLGAAGSLFGVRPANAQLLDRSKSKLQQVLSRGKLIVGTGSTNPPWHFEDASGALQGMDIDVARQMAKALFEDEKKVEFIRQAADARIPSLLTDRVDIVIQFMTVTPGRAQQVEFTFPYYREGVGLLLSAQRARFKDFAALKAAGNQVRVSALQNVFAEQWAHLALPQSQVNQFDSPDTALQALNAGRVDAYMADQSAVRWLMAQAPGRYIDSGYGWMPNSYSAAVRPGDPIWLNWVNGFLKEAMMGVGFDDFAASYKKWFGIELETPKVGFPSEFA